MSESSLPPGCDIRFARPSLWREYRWYVLGALVLLLAQAALIPALLMQRRGRRRAEEETRHGRAELGQASRLALAGELTASSISASTRWMRRCDIAAAGEAGAVDFLTKPVEPTVLVTAVETALDRDRAARSRHENISAAQERYARLTPRVARRD